MKLLIAVATLAVLTGCAGMGKTLTEERQAVSSGFIGCAQQEISIVNTGNTTWEATCKEKTFYCTVAPSAMCTAKM